MLESASEEGWVIQLRSLPPIRVASLRWEGRRGDAGQAFSAVQDFARRVGKGPCGPLIGRYHELPPAIASMQGAEHALVRIEAFAPLTDLPKGEEGGTIHCLRRPRMKAACLVYSDFLGPSFRAAHEALFRWVDLQGLRREGDLHEHAYLAGAGAAAVWTIEIRVPVT